MSFADLHHGPLPLLLPNAWDVASALGFVAAGFEAVGTTSFGVSAAAGHPDGARATAEANTTLAKALTRLGVHVSMDVEDGYSDDPAEVASYVAGLGVAGVNLEDSKDARLVDPAAHAAKVAAVKAAAPDVFVNARVDNLWFHEEATLDAVVARARAYVAAGADGDCVPGATEPDLIRELAAAIPAPLNELVGPAQTLHDLGALGVRRVSTGSLPYRAALDRAVEVATDVRDGLAVPGATSYAEVQERLVRFEHGHQD